MTEPIASSHDRAFFGHPRGLSTLFFTELWERFSYYGMRAILVLFMTTPEDMGGLGFAVGKAGAIYGTYVSMVYLLALPGGWLADRVLGLRKAIFLGGIVIMFGHISLAVPGLASFYLGLVLIALGTGALKPSISAVVGHLYGPEDTRRDAGFSIYYMGINLGAFLSPLAVGYLAQHPSFRAFLDARGIAPESAWHFGFALAALGMFFGLVQFVLGGKYMGTAGLEPVVASPEEGARAKRLAVNWGGASAAVLLVFGLLLWQGVLPIEAEQIATAVGYLLVGATLAFFAWLFLNPGWTPAERRRLVVIAVLFAFAVVFWSAFEQAGSSLNLFSQNQTDSRLFGWAYPPSWMQSVNSLFIITLAPVFAWIWIKLGSREPSTTAKFAFGLVNVGAGFGVMFVAASLAAGGQKVSPMWLIVTYLLHTIGELTLSPVGLSAMTKLAPVRVSGLMMGLWFVSIAMGGYVAGGILRLYEAFTIPQVFAAVTGFAVLAGVVMYFLVKPVGKLEAQPESEAEQAA